MPNRNTRSASATQSRQNSKGMMSSLEASARDFLPEAKTLKPYLPTAIAVGAVVLGAAGIYALWKNRDKVEAFMDEHDISVPSFVKDGISSVKDSITSLRSDSSDTDQIAAH